MLHKNFGRILLAVMIAWLVLSFTGHYAKAQTPQINQACKPGAYIGSQGIITGVNMDGDHTWSITIETPAKNVYVLQYAPTKVASAAGSLLGQTVTIHGAIATSFPNCEASFLINWNFKHHQ